MNPILAAAVEVERIVRAAGFPFCFIGGIAVQPRMTVDIDLTVITGFGDEPVHCPLVSLFAASNELPEGTELEALFDRFLLRFDVGYLLVASNLRGVLVGPELAIAATLTMDELRRAQGEVAAVKVTDDTVDALLAIRNACRDVEVLMNGSGDSAAAKTCKRGSPPPSGWLPIAPGARIAHHADRHRRQ